MKIIKKIGENTMHALKPKPGIFIGDTFREFDAQAFFAATISPNQAEGLLSLNTKNRKIRIKHLSDLIRDINAGDWSLNGDAIRISSDGVLLDGQHRLLACKTAGKAITTCVVTGLPGDVMPTIDRGATRSLGDQLSLRGVKNASKTAAAARALVGLIDGSLNSARITSNELMAIIDTCLTLPDVAASTQNPVCSSGFVPAIYYTLLEDGYVTAAIDWQKAWVSGVPAYEGCPVHALRERIMRSKTTANRLQTSELMSLGLAARAALIERKPVRLLKSSKGAKLPGWSRVRIGI